MQEKMLDEINRVKVREIVLKTYNRSLSQNTMGYRCEFWRQRVRYGQHNKGSVYAWVVIVNVLLRTFKGLIW